MGGWGGGEEGLSFEIKGDDPRRRFSLHDTWYGDSAVGWVTSYKCWFYNYRFRQTNGDDYVVIIEEYDLNDIKDRKILQRGE